MPKHLRLLATAALFLAPLLVAQQPSPDLAGIAHVALRVHDLRASIAFYEKLGFVKAFDLSRDGQVYEAFIKINDRQFIELYPTDAKNTEAGFLHLCFEGNDLNSVHDYYVAHGLTPNAVRTAGAGNLLFTMPGPMTPQGLQNMEYTQYLPGSLHSRDFGQHLGPSRIADKLTKVTVAASDPVAAEAFYQDKLGFAAAAKENSLRIPGSGQQVEFVSSEKQGNLAHITLGSPRPGEPAHAYQTLTDPDKNILDIWGKARVLLLEKKAK